MADQKGDLPLLAVRVRLLLSIATVLKHVPAAILPLAEFSPGISGLQIGPSPWPHSSWSAVLVRCLTVESRV